MKTLGRAVRVVGREVGRVRYGSSSVVAAGSEEAKVNPIIRNYEPTAEEEERDPQLAGLKYPPLNLPNRAERKPLGWWDNQERVNYNEAVDENDDVLGFLAPAQPKFPVGYALKRLGIALGTIGAVSYGLYAFQPAPRWAPQQFPEEK